MTHLIHTTHSPRQGSEDSGDYALAQLRQVLQECGLPEPAAQQYVLEHESGPILSTALTYDADRLEILLDAKEFPAIDRITLMEELERRNTIELSGRRLLEWTVDDVIARRQAVVDMLIAMLGRGMIPPPPNAQAPGHHSFTVSPAGLEFRRLLSERDANVSEREIQIAERVSVEALAVDEDRSLLLLEIDPDDWIDNSERRQFDLHVSNHLRVCGWTLVRVSRPWLDPGERERVIERLSERSSA